MPPPNSGEKFFFGQTLCNIRAVDIFLEERTGTLYFLTVGLFCFSFYVYMKYSFEFRNLSFYLFKVHSVILAAHFINFSYILFRVKMSRPAMLTELLRLWLGITKAIASQSQDHRIPSCQPVEQQQPNPANHSTTGVQFGDALTFYSPTMLLLLPTRNPSSYFDMHTHASSALHNPMTLTFDL